MAIAREIRREVAVYLYPPPHIDLSTWGDEHYRLAPEQSADPGRWITLAFQKGVMDAITDPAVEWVIWMKSARVGATSVMNITVGYHMDADPCGIMLVQPTVEDAEGHSKDAIAPMLTLCPRLVGLVAEAKSKDSANTILDKRFPGGKLLLVGANSPRGFRRVAVRALLLDEVDAYPPSAGTEGDPVKLAEQRTSTFPDRKIFAASTPALEPSRIESLYLEGDQRRFLVPCPHCGVFDELVFQQEEQGKGHRMIWPDGEPEAAHFICSGCRQAIEAREKWGMIEAGFWQASAPFKGKASFHIWAAYSPSPAADWGKIAVEYTQAVEKGTEALKVFWNTVLGKPWRVRGEAPEWRRLYDRREDYQVGTVPAGVILLTAGVDVQRDRLYYEVVGWGARKESWSIEAGYLLGDTSHEDNQVWKDLDELLDKRWDGADGSAHALEAMAIDSGFNTQLVYTWARKHRKRVLAVKGKASATKLIGSPVAQEITWRGRKIPNGVHLYTVGVSMAKEELYSWLRGDSPTNGEHFPAGFCHFPKHPSDDEFFKQLTAEQLVTVRKRTGHSETEWQLLPGRQNHWLDCRIYSRCAAALDHLDRKLRDGSPPVRSRPVAPPQAAQPRLAEVPPAPQPQPRQPRKLTGWLAKGRDLGSRKGGWLKR